MKREQSKVLQKVLSNIDPETKARVNLEMECLMDWKTCYEDILEQAKEEGIGTESIEDKLINLSKYFYIKGINDVYNKLKKLNS